MFKTLKEQVCRANLRLVAEGLVTLTWGNVSGISADRQHVAIKPSGVDYESMAPEDMVVLDWDGNVVEGRWRPSSDTPTHLALYRHFPEIGGIAHTHSRHATPFAQARRQIPCLGTTHADHFHGPVPVTRPLTEREVDTGYETHTGTVIVERLRDADRDPLEVPAVLVAGHGPFTWGSSADEAVRNAVALEAVAQMAIVTLGLKPDAPHLESYVVRKHHRRKHGPDAYYGQDPV
jgi:L-ribulose-5-phosphate 4-epimerase